MGQACEIPISSLIAVSLLKKNVVSDLELSKLINDISNLENNDVYILDIDEDPYFHYLLKYIVFGNNYFALRNDLTLDAVFGHKKLIEILEVIAGDFILNYMGYDKKKRIFLDKSNQSNNINNVKVKRRSLYDNLKFKHTHKIRMGA